MASINTQNLDGLMMDFAELASLPDWVAEEMLNAGADVIVEAQKKTARTMGVVDTGQLAASITKSRVKFRRDRAKVIHVYPQGERKRGNITTKNAEIAFVDEFGKQGQPARPFIRTSVEQSADKAIDAMFKVYDRYLTSKNL